MHQTFTLVSSLLQQSKINKQQSEMAPDRFTPSNSVISNILNYSKSLTIKQSQSVGFIEIVAS